MPYRVLVFAAFLLPVAAAPFPRAQSPAPRRRVRASKATGFVSILTAQEASTGLGRRCRRRSCCPA